MAEKTMTLDQLAGQIRALLETHPGNTPVYLLVSGRDPRAIREVDMWPVSKSGPARIVSRGGIGSAMIR